MIQIGTRHWKNEVTIAYKQLDESMIVSFLYLQSVNRILP